MQQDQDARPSLELEGTTRWRTIQNDYFQCSLPENWQIGQLKRSEWDTDVSFDVAQPDGTTAFTITVATDKPRFVECYCTGWDAYDYFTRDGIDFANVYMDEGNLRTLKAKGSRYGTDVHLSYGTLDRGIANRIVESVRPQ